MKKQFWAGFSQVRKHALSDVVPGLGPAEGAFWLPGAVAVVWLAFLLLGALLWTSPLHAAPHAQGVTNGDFFELRPVAGTAAELQTHTADINLAQENDATLATVEARYRVRNGTDAALNLLVEVVPQGAGDAAAPAEVSLLANEQPVALQPREAGSLTGQIPLAAGGRSTVVLRYRVDLGTGPLVDLRYDGAHLAAWSGDRSLRVAFDLPAAVPPESWLRLAPEGWSDLVGSENGIKWLYDGVLPEEPMLLQFIHPATWARLQEAGAAAKPGANPAAFQTLGDLYRTLYAAAGRADAALRFYAQALAAYTGGLDAAGTQAEAAAPLQAGMAELYRSRVVDATGATDVGYAVLMTQTARAAAAALPAQTPRWQEMMRWQQEGLTLQLIDARARRDWVGALALIEQLAALPADFVDAARLAQTRREVEIQQALQLLDQGDRSAALALAGEGITDLQLTPAAAAQSLFAAWQITVTVGVDGTELQILAEPAADAASVAWYALAEQLARWDAVDPSRDVSWELTEEAVGDGTNSVRLTINLAAEQRGTELATLLGGGPQWAMLRSVLDQVDPQVERRGRLFWEESTLRQTLNLGTVADQWRAMAATLERDARQFEAQAAALAREPATAEDALQAEIQAVNYRNAAEAWQELEQSSWVVMTLVAPSQLDSLARTWLMRPGATNQVMEFTTQTVNPTRVLVFTILGIMGLLLFSGLLWRLL